MPKLSLLSSIAGGSLLAACLALIPTDSARGLDSGRGLGSAPVTVVNPADIAKAEGIQHPYQHEAQCGFGGGSSCVSSFNTPPNQRLVFEYISGVCAFPPGQKLSQVVVSTQAGGEGVTHRLGIIDHAGVADSDGTLVVPFGQIVRIYADQSTTVLVQGVGPRGTSNIQTCAFIFSGQAIDGP